MENNDLGILDNDIELDNTQDTTNTSSTNLNIAPTAPEDIEKMLGLLSHPEASKRMLAARVFCELSEPRSIPLLIHLLDDICPLVRVSTTYALGRNTGQPL